MRSENDGSAVGKEKLVGKFYLLSKCTTQIGCSMLSCVLNYTTNPLFSIFNGV